MSDAASDELVSALRRIGSALAARVVARCEALSSEQLARVAVEAESDTQYAIDAATEAELVELVEIELQHLGTVVLVAEGLEAGAITIGRGEPRHRLLVDPIDGTRGLMHQKRPAWVLMALAPDRGPETRLSDISVSVQTEIPLLKQHLADQLWCAAGVVGVVRGDRTTGLVQPIALRPSRATGIEHGFATLARFFPGAQARLGALADSLFDALMPAADPSRARCFEDQYISTGGQLYELAAGHDRLVLDLRPLLCDSRLACHPYDICTLSIAAALGVEVTGPAGEPLDAPLDTTTPIAWIGYANRALRDRIEPVILPLIDAWRAGR
jgi:hypothetical protein